MKGWKREKSKQERKGIMGKNQEHGLRYIVKSRRAPGYCKPPENGDAVEPEGIAQVTVEPITYLRTREEPVRIGWISESRSSVLCQTFRGGDVSFSQMIEVSFAAIEDTILVGDPVSPILRQTHNTTEEPVTCDL